MNRFSAKKKSEDGFSVATPRMTNFEVLFKQEKKLGDKFFRITHSPGAVTRRGYALECRVYAEDPANNFAPSAGVITALHLPVAPFARVDHDLAIGQEITPFFDPMIAKITTFGRSRDEATAHMREALRQLVIGGLTTNIPFLQKLLLSDEFKTGRFHTQLLADRNVVRCLMTADDESGPSPAVVGVVAAVLLEFFGQHHGTMVDGRRSADRTPANRWRSRAWK